MRRWLYGSLVLVLFSGAADAWLTPVEKSGWLFFAVSGTVFICLVSVAAGWYLKYLRQHWKEVAAGVVLFCLSMGFLLGVVAYGDLAASYIVSAFSDSGDGWVCVERGRTMYSLSDSGELGAAEKGCTCAEIANFEYLVFGEVDYQALNDDHGCSFE